MSSLLSTLFESMQWREGNGMASSAAAVPKGGSGMVVGNVHTLALKADHSSINLAFFRCGMRS